MIHFVVPLRSKAASRNWEMVSLLFNRMLTSVFNQTSPEFRVIVACHDIPQLSRQYDERLEFIQVDCPIPRSLDEQMKDKGYKVHALGHRLRELGGGYAMQADGDDLLSRRLAALAASGASPDGWSVDTGYLFYLDRGVMKYAPKFPGRTAIIHFRPDDLPATMDDAWTASTHDQPYLIRKGHGNIAAEARAMGRHLEPLPFKGFVYVLGTGDNHSTLSGRRSKRRWLFERVTPSVRITEELKAEFAMDWIP